jgi:mannose-1-phosphate guanylyltransferase
MQNIAKGIILPSAISEAFKPLTYQMPVGLLPVVNKPIMEHQIELFTRHGIKNVRISCNHLSNKVEAFFDNGSRWGASVSYNFERPPFGFVTALRQMRPFFENETLVIMQSDVIASIDLKAALEQHWAQRADATFIVTSNTDSSGLSVMLDEGNRIHAVGMHNEASTKRHPVDAGICMIEPEILDLVSDTLGYNLLQACWLASQNAKLHLFGYHVEEPLIRVINWGKYFQVQKDILEGKFPGLQIPGIQIEPGVWVGKNVSASSAVSFEPPLAIGDNCRIGKGVKLGKGTILGHDVMVDVGASLNHTVVLSKTFVGPQTSIQDSIIQGNLMIDIEKETFMAIDDKLAALEIERPKVGFSLYAFANRVLALLNYIVLSPLLLLLFIGLILGLKFPLITRVRRIAPDLKELGSGKLRLRVLDLIYLGPADLTQQPLGHNPDPLTTLPHLIARIGNLTNVIKGEIMLVGNRPMNPELAFSITEEWRRTRFKCQAGIISILDTDEVETTTDEEQVIAEGYYAVHRTLWMDISILARGVWRLFWRMLGRKKVVREYRPIPIEEPATLE